MASKGTPGGGSSALKANSTNQHRRTGSKNSIHHQTSPSLGLSTTTSSSQRRLSNIIQGSQSAGNGNPGKSHLTNIEDSDMVAKHMNDRLLYGLVRSIGCRVVVTSLSGRKFVGVLYTAGDITESGVSIILKYPRQLKDKLSGDEIEYEDAHLPETLIFMEKEIAMIEFEDVKFSSHEQLQNASSLPPTKGFKTDSDISSATVSKERELQKWVPDDELDSSLSVGLEETSSDGHWDQFEVNERKFGIHSTYNEELYTTKLSKEAPDYQQRLKEAERIAMEIESQSHHGNVHLAEERGLLVDDSGFDEEDKYSGVARENNTQNEGDALLMGMLKANSKDIKSELRPIGAGRYVPPRQRAANFHGDPAIVASSATEKKRSPKSGESQLPNLSYSQKAQKGSNSTSTSTVSPPHSTDLHKANVQHEINSLKEFAASFKLPSKLPPDLLPILSKDKERQQEIMQKSEPSDLARHEKRMGSDEVTMDPKVTKEDKSAGTKTPTPLLSKKKMDPRTAPTFKMNPNSAPFSPSSFTSSRGSPVQNSSDQLPSPQAKSKKDPLSFFGLGKVPQEPKDGGRHLDLFDTKFNILVKARTEYEDKNETKNVFIINVEKPFATPPTWPSTIEESYKMVFSKQPEWISNPAGIPQMQKRMYQMAAQPFPVMAPPPQQQHHQPVPQPMMMPQTLQMDPHNMHIPQPTFVVPQFQQPQFIPLYQPPPNVPQMAYGIPQGQNVSNGVPVPMRPPNQRNSRAHHYAGQQQQVNIRSGSTYKY